MVKNMVALRPAAVAVALCCFAATVVVAVADVHQSMTDDTNVLMDTVDRLFEVADNYELTPGVRVRRAAPQEWADSPIPSAADRVSDPEKYLFDKVSRYVGTHILDINFVEMFRSAGRAFISLPRLNFGKNSFLTGFGLGFLAFGLKKLLLPVIIGAQIIKSIALAALLPTILGSVGKIVSKGVTNFAAGSSHFNPNGADGLNDFEFKDQPQNYGLGYDTAVAADTSGSETGYQNIWTYPPDNSMNAITTGYSNSRYPVKYGQNTGISNTKIQSGNYYTKDKTEDFKVFQTIPTSSHLLANYDPFYSPLLSRIDTVFKQLGYTTEPCRERLVCQMYKNPAKFAPYSNLVSAQLSRELNELRKPSSENPEILRFFKYMKAAKDGQDNQQCEIMFSSCMSQRSPDDSVPMMTTYNEINKLVLARNAKKIKDSPAVDDAKSESPAIDVAKSESPAVDVAKSESPAVDVTKSESPAIDVVKSESPAVDVAKSESSAIDVAKSESSAVVIADKVSEPNSK